MNRLYEEITAIVADAPASLAASTDRTTAYINGAGRASIDFVLQLASLASGKKLTAVVYSADDSSGTNATQIGTATFTASAGLTGAEAIVSVDVEGNRGAYYAVKYQHDSAAAVVCGCVALCREIYCPADNGWVLKV